MSLDIDCFISAIHTRPSLWDQSHKKYLDRDFSATLWKEVADICNTTEAQAKKKWKHLRDNFRSELKKEAKSKSGDEVGSSYKSQWKWYSNMVFLKGILMSRKMEGNLKDDCERSYSEEPLVKVERADEELMSFETSSHVSLSPEPSTSVGPNRKRKIINTEDSIRMEIEREKLGIMKSMAKCEDEKDTTFHYLMSLRDPINSLPINRQMFVRYKIQEVIMREIEMQQTTNLYTSDIKTIDDMEYDAYQPVQKHK